MVQTVKFMNPEVPDEYGQPTEDTLSVSDDTFALILEIRKLTQAIRGLNR